MVSIVIGDRIHMAGTGFPWKIRALGDVNVGAIEQYKEVKERFEFLTAQREDILAAEEKLRQIIEELSILMEPICYNACFM